MTKLAILYALAGGTFAVDVAALALAAWWSRR